MEVEVDRGGPTPGGRKDRPGLALRRDGGRGLLLQRLQWLQGLHRLQGLHWLLGRQRTLAEVGCVLFGRLAALRVVDQPLVAGLLGGAAGLVEVLVVPATTNLRKRPKISS